MRAIYSRAGVELYRGDNRQVIAELGLKPSDVALLWGDPPYGVRERTARATHGRSKIARARDWPEVVGDDKPFDPAPWLNFPRVVLWGANHYADKLPASGSWWWWDKREHTGPDCNADGELAWTNLGGPARQFHYLWRGFMTAGEKGPRGANTKRVHPTQKPEALAAWGFERAGLRSGDLVLSPWLGSGPEAAVASRMGLRFIGIELVHAYLDACVRRVQGGTT